MDAAKIQFSSEELQLAMNESVILTKNLIIQKVCRVWNMLAQQFKTVDLTGLPEEIAVMAPKLSRGENYRGMPWVMLDYPRLFRKDEIFAIRTLFLWGHDISITLHLKGGAQHRYVQQLTMALLSGNQLNDWWIQVEDNEWQHHRDKNSHQRFGELLQAHTTQYLMERNFVKISYYLSIDQWDNIAEKLLLLFQTLVHTLTGRD